MACACSKRRGSQYEWTSDDGTKTVIYSTEIQAKAAVIRRGGSYKTLSS